jgi:hypothetical protein
LEAAEPHSSYCKKHQPNFVQRDRETDAARHARDPWRKWYGLAAWQNLKESKKNRNPLCERCEKEGNCVPRPAEVIHHKKDHKGNWALFIDPENLESLCKVHHDAIPKTQDGQNPAIEIERPFFASANPAAVDKALELTNEDFSDIKI